MIKRSYLVWVLFIMSALMLSALSSAAFAEVSDMELAEHIARLLANEFTPEEISVTVSEGSAYAQMRGGVMSKIRIDEMKLDAVLTGRDLPLSDDIHSLSSLIGYSRGEIVLLERDVNAYFEENETSGFSGLKFDFTPTGFTAEGVFTTDLLITLNIDLAASGVLTLKKDGVHIDSVKIYTQGIKQPDLIANEVVERVNPLVGWDQIPFRVDFKDLEMDDTSAKMTGYPEPLDEGETYVWRASEQGAAR